MVFIINFIFESYLYILLLRLLLQKMRAPFYNPLSQFIIKVTDPLVKPLQRMIPGVRGFDFAIVFLLVVLEIIALLLLIGLQFHTLPGALGGIIIVIAKLCHKVINVFFFAVIIGAIMSWFPTLQSGPVAEMVFLLSEPILKPVRRWMPLIGGIDLSPLVVILLLQLVSMAVISPLLKYGFQVAF